MALDCSKSSSPLHSKGIVNLVRDLSKTGGCNWAVFQFLPPSKDTSTLFILPLPDQAKPLI